MAVEVNTTRKAVEISWDTSGGGGGIDPPDGFPEPPEIWGGGNEPFPTPPIVIPPDETEPPVDPPVEPPEAPGYNPPVGLPDPPNYPYPVESVVGEAIAVRIFAQGQEGDWSNTAIMANDGLAVLTYPLAFTGESYVEVRSALDGKVIDSGTIEVS